MTSSQSADEERPAVAQAHMIQQLSKSYQQLSREAQEMKRRRRRRFQSQVTVEEADVSYYSRSCRQLPFISTVDESSQDDVPAASYSGSNRELRRFVYPVDMESSRKKADVVESYNPDARYPVAVFEASAVAQISHTVATGVHLWSLGVLTAAGCGIGLVHELSVSGSLLVSFYVFKNLELLQLQAARKFFIAHFKPAAAKFLRKTGTTIGIRAGCS
ncbi:hypothetical protein F511_08682 [Dorcoceras hygrometricum]|uniref:Uncharacterized protein n=1 Tax=Dorcoceras hygrometricum TaxID=472368 RepID=A0A2Z7CNE1_9LAMI|nr:hypothetical protein F511_08682 [Dorcoceras hygrometricum]